LKKRNVKRSEYGELLGKISSLIDQGRRSIVRHVNAAIVATHWLIGRHIVLYEQKGKTRATYGTAILAKLARDLIPRYGKGFSETNLKRTRQFYLSYPIRPTVSDELNAVKADILELVAKKFNLSWSHYTLLMTLSHPKQRVFYERLSLENHWSVRQLDREMNSLLYERTALSKRKEIVLGRALQDPIVVKAEEEIKDPYVLDFLGLKSDYSESELEDALIRHLENFLLELGSGFTFVARQKRFNVGGADYRIDLVFFNRLLKCLVLIDLKVGTFAHADAGQMNFYLNWANREAKLKGENDPIGIVLCSDRKRSFVRYALGGMENKIFVSRYKLKLPDPKRLQNELEKGRRLFEAFQQKKIDASH